ncbi:MAG: polyprenyl diphosphate synthase [Pseudomonadota bacterium]
MSSKTGDSSDITHAGTDVRHVAVIMDGNNRWARSRGLRGLSGHRAGAEAAKRLVFGCIDREIPWLTLFAFSSENWMRPSREVKGLLALFLNVLKRREIRELHERNVRLRFIGNRGAFSERLQRYMRDVERLTRDNTGTTVNVAADYGGRWDIAMACRAVAAEVAAGTLAPESVDVAQVQNRLSLADVPDPDLCIRTGGELRISNFLLWQMAYSELYFTPCYWPDFDDAELQRALDEFSRRQRRFGGHLPSMADASGRQGLSSNGGGPGIA